ncbi:MAG TPA: SH3 domain-containing protein [Rhizomicrobium sp.]|jgi:hypothetical protein
MTSEGLGELKRLINEAALHRITLSETLQTDEFAFARAKRKLALARAFIVRLFTQRMIPRLAIQAKDAGEKLEDTRAQLDECYVDIDFGFDAAAEGTFAAMCRSFEVLRSSQRIWDITATAATDRVKERTTATQSISRTPVQFSFSQVDIIRSKYQTVRFGNVSGLEVHLYPGFLLTREPGTDFALIEWKDAAIQFKISRFIEEEAVPKDSEVVGNTWAKANKDGSPDRRFSDNHQIPIVKYGELWFGSPTGLLEAYMVSNCGSAENFSIAVAHHKDALDKLGDNPQQVVPEEAHDSADDDTAAPEVEANEPSPPPPRMYLDWVGLVVLVIAIAYSGYWLDTHIPALLSALRQTTANESIATEPAALATMPSDVSREVVYVHSKAVNVRSAPSVSGRIIEKAVRGTKFNVFSVKGRWTEVGEDKPVGWVLSTLLRPTAS